jgi:DNA-damage-inducible protein D
MGEVNYGDFTKSLDNARKLAPNGQEYWMGRDVQIVLNYARWENFEEVLRKGMLACEGSGQPAEHHFRQTTKMVELGSGSKRKITDWFLSRYACYLVAMNGDPRVSEVAYAQQYFAMQTRLHEQQNEYDRLEHRHRVSRTVKALNSAAKRAGVQRYGLFHDAGYRGLYGGLGLSAIKARKGIGAKEELLDRAGRVELAAIELKNAITEEQLISLKIQGEQRATDTHNRVGREIRGAMEKSGATMPEDLKPEEPIKNLIGRKQPPLLPPDK